VSAARKARARLVESRDEQVRVLKTGDNFRLHCRTSGRPTPRVTWFKDGEPLTKHSGMVVQQSGSVPINSLRPNASNKLYPVSPNPVLPKLHNAKFYSKLKLTLTITLTLTDTEALS